MMEATMTTAAAVLAAGAMIAAAVYFKPMPGRYHMLKDDVGVRFDTAVGTFDVCERTMVAEGKPKLPTAEDVEWLRSHADNAQSFEQAFGPGSAEKYTTAASAGMKLPTMTQIDAMRNDPSLMDEFEEAFGSGSVRNYLGSAKYRILCTPFEG